MQRSASLDSLPHRFVVPELAGPSTGGTVYNRELIGALGARGVTLDVLSVTAAERALAAREPGRYWVDTLFLGDLRRLRQRAQAPQRLGLLAHYLPSLVRHGAGVTRAELTSEETDALELADAFVAPSAFMRATLERLGVRASCVSVVEPGRFARGLAPLTEPSAALRALVVAHWVPGKGVDQLLAALATQLAPGDRLELTVCGSAEQDAAHAATCRRLATAPSLRECVTFAGELTPEAVNARLAESDVLLSASSMESFGMALAEARTLGVPIIARVGGNVENLVSAESGGELVADASAVAAACVAACRNRASHAARRERARARALPPRSWNQAADEFLARTEEVRA